MTIINDYRRYIIFIFWRVSQKYQTRPDRGEYLATCLKDFKKKQGIQHEYRVIYLYIPEQNMMTERKNRSLVEMARCMLTNAGLRNCLWGEATNAANHIQNRLLNKATDTTP
jgi:hypothetical protein